MKILDAGTTLLSNADVLHWIQAKRAQHAREDAADKARGIAPTARPSNYLSALKKHERELTSPKYPYRNCPAAYAPDYEGMRRFENLFVERIIEPLGDKYRGKGMSAAELDKTLGKEQEMKSLTETEMLVVYNLAPRCMELLQPMIENCEERFTSEEQERIVECVMEAYRYGERKGDEGQQQMEET
ncbi:hypothetical protein M433DRAFT_8852 [Acidomyces richmondensis BFW]|nr:MAG: hypothetical protein FE78DRAFT_267595 [Acidomyces sp. 'richmondensis']KYG40402.1 hypothetical protein M433DRAFT_8852 [Acidomyces richmondensis BFW]